MQLVIFNISGSTKTYLSGAISVTNGGSTSVTNTVQQLALATDGTLRSDLFVNNIYLSDGTNNFGATDGLNYLYEIVQVLGPNSDGLGNNLTSTSINSKQRLDINSASEGIIGSTTPFQTQLVGGSDGTNLRNIKVDSSGTQYIGITSSALGALGLTASVSATGSLSVAPPSGTLFADNFDSSGLDTTNRWTLTLATGATQTQSLGTCTLNTTTSASSAAQLASQPTFTPAASFYFAGIGVQYEATLQTNTHRFWGFGTPAASFTAATPLLNAVGFEIDTSANLNAVVYSNGTKILSTSLNAYKSSSALSYVIVFRADAVLFYISTVGFDIPVASFNNYVLDSLILPWRTHLINSTTPPASAPSLALTGLAVGDTNPSNTSQLSDGTYQWRKALVTSLGSQAITPTDGYKTSYSASVTGLVSAAAATDFFTITGSATKTIRVTNIELSGTTGGLGAQTADIQLLKRSTANTAGTSVTRINVPHDSTSTAATATVRSYTANPTIGTLVGQLRSQRIDLPNGGNSGNSISWEFGSRPSQAIVIRGITEVLSLNLNAVSLNGPLLDVSIEWTEE